MAWGPTPKPGCSVAFATLHRLKAVLGPKGTAGFPCVVFNRQFLLAGGPDGPLTTGDGMGKRGEPASKAD